MAGEKFKEQKGLRCGWRRDVASTMAQTKFINNYLMEQTGAKSPSVGLTLYQPTNDTLVTQTKSSYNDHQQKSIVPLTKDGTSLEIKTVVSQEKEIKKQRGRD